MSNNKSLKKLNTLVNLRFPKHVIKEIEDRIENQDLNFSGYVDEALEKNY